MHKTLIIAHRGASGYSPENTLAAFKKAIEMGADGIELDVHLSKDRELIVCHDEKVDRTTDGVGFIKDLTLNEIKKLDAGSWFSNEFFREKVPTLREVLSLVKGRGLLINIELKNDIIQYEGLEEEVVKLIQREFSSEDVVISSFNHYAMMKIRELSNNLRLGLLYACGLVEPWDYAIKLGAHALHLIHYSVFPQLVEECIKRNIDINTYTVNSNKDIERVLNLGVSSIITDYPDRAKYVLNKLYKTT